MPRKWTDEELAFIRDNYYTMTTTEIARRLKSDKTIIKRVAVAHGLGGDKHRYWKTGELRYMRENYNVLTPKEIAKHLGRSVESVKKQAERQGLTKPLKWDEARKQKFIELYPVTSNDVMKEIFGFASAAVVIRKAKDLGVHKASNYKSEIIREQIGRKLRARYAVDGRSEKQEQCLFKQGHNFGNRFTKGMKFSEETIAKRKKKRAQTVEEELRRIRWQLPQKTKLNLKISKKTDNNNQTKVS